MTDHLKAQSGLAERLGVTMYVMLLAIGLIATIVAFLIIAIYFGAVYL